MKKSLKKQSNLANGIFIIFIFIVLFMMTEMGKISKMQKIERDHAELTQALTARSFEIQLELQKGNDISGVLNRTDKKVLAGGTLQILDSMVTKPQEVLDMTNGFEKWMFSVMGFARAFELAYEDIDDIENVKKNVAAFNNGEIMASTFTEKNKKLNTKLQANGAEFAEIVVRAAALVKNMMFFGTLFLLGSISIQLYRVSTRIVNSINKIREHLELVSEGDISTEMEVKQDNELGMITVYTNKLIGKLREVIGDITAIISELNEASNKFNTVAAELYERASGQASSAEEISASLEELASNTELNNAKAQETQRIAENVSQEINQISSTSNESLTSVESIVDKILIVNDLASQTNLLALNAAVEAARAGEHGKGFAVVAKEVRQLAEKSQASADEITELAQTTLKVTQDSGSMTMAILPSIEKTSELVKDIAKASVEQKSSTDQLNNFAQGLNDVTQQNSEASQSMAAQSSRLVDHAQKLKERMSFFKMK